jgi:hypothetical protein
LQEFQLTLSLVSSKKIPVHAIITQVGLKMMIGPKVTNLLGICHHKKFFKLIILGTFCLLPHQEFILVGCHCAMQFEN